jgi:nuclease S1
MNTFSKSCRVALVCMLTLAWGAARSFGFGPVGHETVAYIAEDRLSPATLKKVNDILGHDDDLASVSNWADAIRNFQEETKPWHFIDLPIRQVVTAAQVTDFCPNNDCVIAQIQINKGVLTNPTASSKEKLRALKFIVHFSSVTCTSRFTRRTIAIRAATKRRYAFSRER